MKNIFYTIMVIFFCNCGSLPKYKKDDLKPITNEKQIEGVYKNYKTDSLKLLHNSLNGEINWRKKEVDSTKYSSVKITVLNNKRLQFDFQVENEIKKSKIVKYRLRNNGFIKLRNRNFRICGIPLIFGEYEVKKYELGLNHNNDLILHSIDDSGGGILIILSGGWDVESDDVFERI